MYFPIADVTISPILLMSVGFLVGILGGFFGVGGGFLAGPMMFWAGVPMNFVVGTDLAHMTGKSIVAARRHRALGHVDLKLGSFMIIGTVIGVEIGARIIEALQQTGALDVTIGVTYVIILIIISGFTAWESIRAIQMVRTDQIDVKDAVGFKGLAKRVQGIQIPPMVSFPVSGIESISIWMVLGVGFITGLLAGSLGVGGGFIRMPMLVYVVGVPTHVAVGTDLFEIVFSSGFGTITHAIKGNVDILMALV
ncbi:MAG: sulfite exporter TauE/SafE family protein, partial [Anaerolineales bacterium]